MQKSLLLIRLLAVGGIAAVIITAVSFISLTRNSSGSKASASSTPCGFVTGVSYNTDAVDADKMSAVTVSATAKGSPCAGARAMITVYGANNAILKTAFCDIDKDTCTALGVNQSVSAVGRVDVKLIGPGANGPNQPASALGH